MGARKSEVSFGISNTRGVFGSGWLSHFLVAGHSQRQAIWPPRGCAYIYIYIVSLAQLCERAAAND